MTISASPVIGLSLISLVFYRPMGALLFIMRGKARLMVIDIGQLTLSTDPPNRCPGERAPVQDEFELKAFQSFMAQNSPNGISSTQGSTWRLNWEWSTAL